MTESEAVIGRNCDRCAEMALLVLLAQPAISAHESEEEETATHRHDDRCSCLDATKCPPPRRMADARKSVRPSSTASVGRHPAVMVAPRVSSGARPRPSAIYTFLRSFEGIRHFAPLPSSQQSRGMDMRGQFGDKWIRRGRLEGARRCFRLMSLLFQVCLRKKRHAIIIARIMVPRSVSLRDVG